jgi:Leucine-rich repeat (LRR) protein
VIAIALTTALALAQGNDIGVVRAILDMNNFTTTPETDVADFEEGRVVSLNLNNPDVTQAGFTTLPPAIGTLTECVTLTLNDNDVRTLPAEIGMMQSLTTLELKNNAIRALPPEIGKLKKLQTLDLRNNELKELPAEIGGLEQLRILQLWGNELTSLPREITNLSNLRELYLRGNRLESLPAGITAMDLRYVGIQDNRLCETDPQVTAWLKKLDEKYLSWQKCWELKK